MMPASEQGTSRRLHLNLERRVLQVVEEEDEEGGWAETRVEVVYMRAQRCLMCVGRTLSAMCNLLTDVEHSSCLATARGTAV